MVNAKIAELLGDPPPQTNLVDASIVADWLGLTVRSVNRLAQDGIIARAAPNAFDLRACVRAYVAHRLVEKPGDADKSRKLAAEADLAEAKAAAIRGEQVNVAGVQAEWSAILRDVRAGMLAVASRVRTRLPALTAAEVGVIDSEIRLALTALGEADG